MATLETKRSRIGLCTMFLLQFEPQLKDGVIHSINGWDKGGEEDFEFALKNGFVEEVPNLSYYYRTTPKGKKYLEENW